MANDGMSPDHRAPARRGSSRLLWVVIIVVLILAMVAAAYFYHRKKAAEAAAAKKGPPEVTISTVKATKGDIGVYLEAIGTVTPIYTASITSQVTGQIANVLFKEGQTVKVGDPLIDIDPRPYRATLLQAQGALERDQNVLAQAQMDLDRYRAALARNAIAQQTEADQEKLVSQDKGTVKNDQGTVQYDEVQLAYCHIIAPISGRVGLRLVDPGNVVQTAGTTPLAVVTQLQPISVIFTLAEDNLAPVNARLREGATLAVDALDRTGQKKIASGTLLALDNQIDTTTGTLKARAQFDNADSALSPNEFVDTRLLVNTLHDVTLVPTATIQQNGQASFVYVVKDGAVEKRDIKAGVADAGQTQVEGVNPGDELADSAFDKLQDKAKVKVSDKPATPGQAPAGASDKAAS